MAISGLYTQPIPTGSTTTVRRPHQKALIGQTDSVHFGSSEVPDILPNQPKTLGERIKAWFKDIADFFRRWSNPAYIMQRVVSFFTERKAKHVLSQLKAMTPEEAQAFMDESPLGKITTAPFQRASTGIAKASHVYGLDAPVMQKYKDPTYLHILDDYGISWSRFKVARDALQNFYDGQGQTLDGVDIQVAPTERGKAQHIRIAASATYDVDKLLALGSTGKKGEIATAGGFGEGAKMMALMLLRDYGAKQVTFRSGEWQADFTLGNPGAEHGVDGNQRGLMVKLSPLNPPIQGNTLEFDTTDAQLADTIRNGHHLFYNPNSPIFQNPTYENAMGGFKIIDGPGRVYEAGQLRAFKQDGHYDAIPSLIAWSNQKVLQLPDRDRVAIQDYDVQTILEEIIDGMSQEEAAQGIQTLRRHWFYQDPQDLVSDIQSNDKQAADMLLNTYCARYAKLSSQKPDFLPDSLVAVSPGQLMSGDEGMEQLQELYKQGYIPVHSALGQVGVPDGASLLLSRDALLEKASTRVESLTPRQQRRAQTIKDTLASLSSALSHSFGGSGLSRLAELPIKVVNMPDNADMFDKIKVSANQNAILVDRQFLDTTNFPELVSRLKFVCPDLYIDYRDQLKWALNHLPHVQQLKATWDQA